MRRLVTVMATVTSMALACRAAEGPRFEVVRLPETAYLTPDAAAPPDAGAREAGSGRGAGTSKPVLPSNCYAAPAKTPSDDEASSDFPDCVQAKSERLYLDPEKTRRTREKMGREDVCCYTAPRYDYGE